MSSILTVVTAAESQALVDLTTVKTQLNLTTTDFDAFLSLKIEQASAAMAAYCRRTFIRQSYSEAWRFPNAGNWCGGFGNVDALRLSNWPFSITSVQESGSSVDLSGFECDPNSGLLYRMSGDERTYWTASRIVVAYDAGFDPVDGSESPPQYPIPTDLKFAVLEAMKEMFFARARDPAVRSRTEQGTAEEYWIGATGDPVFGPKVMQTLDLYRRMDM